MISIKKYNYLIIIILLYFLTSCSISEVKHHPIAKQGVLDLREWNFEKDGNVELNGEWQFIWNELLDPQNIDSTFDKKATFVSIPDGWENKIVNGVKLPRKGYATYRLTVLITKSKHKLLLSSILAPVTSSTVYVNGKVVGESGIPATTKAASLPAINPTYYAFDADSCKLDILVKISNFYDNAHAGMSKATKLGNARLLSQKRDLTYNLNTFLFGTIFILMIYHLALFFLRPKDKTSLYFALFCFWLLGFILPDCGIGIAFYAYDFFSISPTLGILIGALATFSSLMGAAQMLIFVQVLFPQDLSKKIVTIFSLLFWYFAISLIARQFDIFNFSDFDFVGGRVSLMIECILIIYVTIVAIKRKRDDARVFLIGIGTLATTQIIDNLYIIGFKFHSELGNFGLLVFMFAQAFIISSRFTKTLAHNEELNTELTFINKNLEKLVEDRTAEVVRQKDEILEKNEELNQLNEEIITQRDNLQELYEDLQLQNDVIESKNIEIQKKNKDITDSIVYASRIQNAMLPPKDVLAQTKLDYFILFKPRDIVSGDFYWYKRIDNLIYITAADCTGHGVPGAFMSMLGVSLLNEIVVADKTQIFIQKPSEILNELRKRIKKSLHQTGGTNQTQDGMDIAFILIDLTTNMLQFAGAYNPLYLVKSNSQITIIEADRMPIGIHPKDGNEFTNHEIQLQLDDLLYIFTDGYHSQFGGERGEKFKTKRFHETILSITDKPMDEQKELLEQRFNEWKGTRWEQIDDVLVIGLKIGENSLKS